MSELLTQDDVNKLLGEFEESAITGISLNLESYDIKPTTSEPGTMIRMRSEDVAPHCKKCHLSTFLSTDRCWSCGTLI